MAFSEKQLQILTTSEKLFASKGFDGTSIRDIAEEAGVNIAMISYYFGSKEKLMETIFKERTEQTRLRLESLQKDESLSPFEKIWIIVDEYIDKVLQKQAFNRIMFVEQMLGQNVEIKGFIRELKSQNAALFEKIIKDGQKKKVFKKNVDILLLLNTMTGIIMQTLINKEYYQLYNNLQHLSAQEYSNLIKKKVTDHIKVCFTSILKNEE
jgi:AcrR family transcriptional regulator